MRRAAPARPDGTEAKCSELAGRYPALLRPSWRARLRLLMGLGAALGLYLFSWAALDISWSAVGSGLFRLGDFAALMLPPDFGTNAKLFFYLNGLVQTLAISLLGTLLAALLALPIGLVAARNVVPNVFAHFGLRRLLDTLRAVDTLIWALIWINVVGLGPFAGILAIMTSDFGALGKLFSEAIEATEAGPTEAMLSTGSSKLQAIRLGLLPQALPVFLSQILYFFESNTRSATIIGIVGAGGIGASLYEEIQVNEWQHVAFIVLLILITVSLIDQISSRLRLAIIGRPGG